MDFADDLEMDEGPTEPDGPPEVDCAALLADWHAALAGTRISRWMQYVYLLRFSILTWLLLPLLCVLDGCTGVSSLTRGIMTLSRQWQAFYVMFFVTALMVTVLVCVRNTVRNGKDRFSTAAPAPLFCWLHSAKTEDVLMALGLAQVPAVVTLGYIALITVHEQRIAISAHETVIVGFGPYAWRLWVGYGVGLLFAFLFWYAVSIVYLWTYPKKQGDEPASLIFPQTMPGFARAEQQPRPRLAAWLEQVAGLALRLTHAGYAADANSRLWELHSFSAVALAAFFLLYLVLYPLLAPINIGGELLDVTVSCGVMLLCLVGASDARGRPKPGEPVLSRWVRAKAFPRSCLRTSRLGKAFLACSFLLVLVFLILVLVDGHNNSVRLETAFPALASILVMVIFGLWLLAGISFLLDRYRLPVLTLVLALIVGAKFLPVDQEHYFETTETTRLAEDELPAPAEVVHRRSLPDEPLIIVTASGGGIQAAEWTAQAMAQLEKRFREEGRWKGGQYSFHDHVLLVSGVSGGSVGLMPYLLEYTAAPGTGFPKMEATVERRTADPNAAKVDLLKDRLTLAPACSSLEAVAWGLEYYDLQRLLLTVRVPWLQTASDGDAPDRTWALSRALNRNLNDPDCGTRELMSNKDDRAGVTNTTPTDSGLPRILTGETLTLKRSAGRLREGTMPAFTFNTTVAETGGRFLLSNYGLHVKTAEPPAYPTQAGDDFLPAENFLHAYTQSSACEQGSLKQDCYADLSLATAARLSATFPVVSSGTRLPKRFATYASHFLDGGYFDNDGTASVIEFLKASMPCTPEQEETQRKLDPTKKPADCIMITEGKPLQILLIEIRDGDDLNPEENQDDWKHQTGMMREAGKAGPQTWTSNTQLIAPLLGMWNAGHVSVTRRNRRELCLLERAWGNKLDVHHVVLGIPAQPSATRADQYKTAPLSWKLTAEQRAFIEDWATRGAPTQASIGNAIQWVKSRGTGEPTVQASESCQVLDQSYMRR